MKIVYYAHHHGSGHLRHARRLKATGLAEVVVVGPPGSDVVLPPDVSATSTHRQPAGSPFHWTPTTPEVRRRFSTLHRVLDEVQPELVMVDVSVEAAVFCHLAGYRVLHRRMPGERTDPAHQLAHATSELLFAYYPRELEDPGFAWASRTRWLGMPDDHPDLRPAAPEAGTVVVISGAGGGGVALAELERAARSTPSRQWQVLGPVSGTNGRLPGNLHLHGWVDDPMPWLQRAELVVCGAGHNTLAAVAAARRRTVLVPEERPHDEQLAFARQLHRHLGVPVVEHWDQADWPSVLEQASPADALADGLLVTPGEFSRRMGELLAEAVGSPRG